MVVIFEVDNDHPLHFKPGRYESDVLVRYWWMWFAVSFLKVSAREYAETAYIWEK